MITRKQLLLSTLAAGAVGCLGTSRAFADAEPPVFVGKDGWLFPSWEHETGIPADLVATGLHQIKQASTILDEVGIKLVISMAPSKSRVYMEYLPSTLKISPEFVARYYHALNFFAKSGIPATNVLDAMLAAKSANILFMKSDSHWNSYGSRAAAEATAKTIGVPSPPPNPLPDGVSIPGAQSELDIAGDLVPLLPPALQKNYPRDPLIVTAYSRQGGVTPTTFEVALVGTSCSKENLGFSEIVSNEIAKPVDLYWQWGSIGPWRELTQYFEIAQKAGKPLPKILVWQFSDYVLGTGPNGVNAWGRANSYPSASAWYAALRASLKR